MLGRLAEERTLNSSHATLNHGTVPNVLEGMDWGGWSARPGSITLGKNTPEYFIHKGHVLTLEKCVLGYIKFLDLKSM